MVFEYAGDDLNKNRMVSWFEAQLKAIGTCVNADHPEAALALIYSGIDTFGLLSTPASVMDASGDTFKHWCEKYVLPRIQSVEGNPISAVDLWAARCGVLHTSTPLSKLEREGNAHQIWYEFNGKAGMNLIMDARLEPVGMDIMALGVAFRDGGIECITELNKDPAALQAAIDRSQHFLRWGKRVV